MNGATPSISKPSTAQKHLRILHVDDMAELRDIVRLSLEREGHTVESYADGISALNRIKEQPEIFDLFMSDHHMPKMNGLELVQQLRQLPFRGKIFIFSSEIDEEVNDVYLTLKVDLLLPKPIILPELKQLLAEF